jgi:predicted GNAT family N-acyltransferase
MGLREHLDASFGQAQRLVAFGRAAPLQQASGEQIDLQRVGVGPTGRAVDLAQTLLMAAAEAEAEREGGRKRRHALTLYTGYPLSSLRFAFTVFCGATTCL